MRCWRSGARDGRLCQRIDGISPGPITYDKDILTVVFALVPTWRKLPSHIADRILRILPAVFLTVWCSTTVRARFFATSIIFNPESIFEFKLPRHFGLLTSCWLL